MIQTTSYFADSALYFFHGKQVKMLKCIVSELIKQTCTSVKHKTSIHPLNENILKWGDGLSSRIKNLYSNSLLIGYDNYSIQKHQNLSGNHFIQHIKRLVLDNKFSNYCHGFIQTANNSNEVKDFWFKNSCKSSRMCVFMK